MILVLVLVSNTQAISRSIFLTAYVTFGLPGECWNWVHICHDQVHLAVWWRRSYYTRSSPTSPGGSKVTYAVKKTELETAWEQG